MWLTDSAIEKKIIRKFTRAEPEPKWWNFRYPVHSLQEKALTNGANGRCAFRRCALAVSTHQISTTPNREPQTRKNRVLEIDFIHPIRLEIFAEIFGQIIFEFRAKMAEISPENPMHGRLQDKRKRLSPENCFCGVTVLNCVIYTAL